jgi:hypothetical protein
MPALSTIAQFRVQMLFMFFIYFSIHLRNEVKQYITDGTVNANIFMTFNNNQPGVVGLAWVGVACSSDITYRASINEYFYTDASTGQVR